MPVSYTVKQGDHLSSIAKAYGFSDYETIWNDPNNAELKQLREDPNVLFPGDVVYIPDRELRVEAKATEVRHKFVKHGKAIKIRLVLEDLFEKPIANAPCDLILGTETFHVVSDDNGQIEHEIKPDVKSGMLIIKDDQTALNGTAIRMQGEHAVRNDACAEPKRNQIHDEIEIVGVHRGFQLHAVSFQPCV